MSIIIDPRPILAGHECMALDLRQYYACYPCIKAFLSRFSADIDVETDLKCALRFLAHYSHRLDTFTAYRTFVERLLLWSWIFAEESVLTLNQEKFTEFVYFCKSPPLNWTGSFTAARFAKVDYAPVFNEAWRPFNIRTSTETDICTPEMKTLRFIRSVCSSFYSFLYAENTIGINPAISFRAFYGREKRSPCPVERYLNSGEINYVLQILKLHALDHPTGERALFIIAATVFMSLQATDLANSGKYFPSMGCFVQDGIKWWLVLDAPNRLLRKVEVNPEFLPYLKRYRQTRGLSLLPEQGEMAPILETGCGRPGLSTRQIRNVVKDALKNVHASITLKGGGGECWNSLLGGSLRFLKESGAKVSAQSLSPLELQRHLGSSSAAYTYKIL